MDIEIPDEWTVTEDESNDLTEVGDYLVVEHPKGLEGTVQVEEGEYDAVDVFATIDTADGDNLNKLWLSSDDYDGDVEVTRDEVVEMFEYWLDEYAE